MFLKQDDPVLLCSCGSSSTSAPS